MGIAHTPGALFLFFITVLMITFMYTAIHNYGNPWFLLYSF